MLPRCHLCWAVEWHVGCFWRCLLGCSPGCLLGWLLECTLGWLLG